MTARMKDAASLLATIGLTLACLVLAAGTTGLVAVLWTVAAVLYGIAAVSMIARHALTWYLARHENRNRP